MFKQFIQDGIIDVQEAYSLNQKNSDLSQDIVFIDSTFVLPSSDIDIKDAFKERHIPGALFFDIKSIADDSSDLPHMLPSAEKFSRALSDMGIRNSDFIIIYAQHGMIMGPARLWWMLKGFGHDNVVVLNGGLPMWERSGFSFESGEGTKRAPSNYKATQFNQKHYADKALVSKVSKQRVYPIIDARPQQRFTGEAKEPRENMRSGSIENSINLPCSLLVSTNGTFKPKTDIHALFQDIGIDTDAPNVPDEIITTCGSGITACALALALHYVEYKGDVRVYDGSWSEWGRIHSN